MSLLTPSRHAKGRHLLALMQAPDHLLLGLHQLFNLQAGMPMRIPSGGSSATLTTCFVPSDYVPGDGAGGHLWFSHTDFSGGGPNCNLHRLFTVYHVKKRGPCCIFYRFGFTL